jgi:hypothetical protein
MRKSSWADRQNVQQYMNIYPIGVSKNRLNWNKCMDGIGAGGMDGELSNRRMLPSSLTFQTSVEAA